MLDSRTVFSEQNQSLIGQEKIILRAFEAFTLVVLRKGVFSQGCHLRYSGVPRADAFFNISLTILVSKCHKTLKQIAMGSPLGAANYICLLKTQV